LLSVEVVTFTVMTFPPPLGQPVRLRDAIPQPSITCFVGG
jgi:hypothetical protein